MPDQFKVLGGLSQLYSINHTTDAFRPTHQDLVIVVLLIIEGFADTEQRTLALQPLSTNF